MLFGELVIGDLADISMLDHLFSEKKFDAVMHFAASIVVPESVENPLKYYTNNSRNTLNILSVCNKFGVKYFVFSSTAAVYGECGSINVSESSLLAPVNPYGASKMMSERMLTDLASSGLLNYVIFRYFNVAGADMQARIGQSTANATHLIKVCCEAALGKRNGITIYGNDYDTRDGTGIRDYIHVEDLAAAHLDGLRYLEAGGKPQIFNCGYGRGYSVLEVIDAVKSISGSCFPVNIGGRRKGDPQSLVANAVKIRQVLDWTPCLFDINVIVKSAFEWESKIL